MMPGKAVSQLAYDSVMEWSAQDTIKKVLKDLRTKGKSEQHPFPIGKIEDEMKLFSKQNGITLHSNEIYMSVKSLKHGIRDSKRRDGKDVPESQLISFPRSRRNMSIFYDGEAFIYVDFKKKAKYVIKPNYELKIDRKKTKVVNYVTSSKLGPIESFADATRFKRVKGKRK